MHPVMAHRGRLSERLATMSGVSEGSAVVVLPSWRMSAIEYYPEPALVTGVKLADPARAAILGPSIWLGVVDRLRFRR